MVRAQGLTRDQTLSLIQGVYRDLALEVDSRSPLTRGDEARDFNDQAAALEDDSAEIERQLGAEVDVTP